jgi:hypothetical protein
MGILRTFSKVLFSTAFVLSLTLLISIFFLSKITDYSTLKQITYPLIEKQLNITEEQKTAILNYLQYRCTNEKEININIGKNISISCEDIKQTNENNITDYLAGKIFDAVYFEKYECELQRCLEMQRFEYFLSFEFHEKISEFFKYLIIVTIVFGLLYFISIESMEGRALSFGIIFLLTSIPYFLIDYSKLLFPQSLKNSEAAISIIMAEFKIQASFLLYFFFAGILLLLIYFLLRIRKRGLLTKNNKRYVAGKRRNE